MMLSSDHIYCKDRIKKISIKYSTVSVQVDEELRSVE